MEGTMRASVQCETLVGLYWCSVVISNGTIGHECLKVAVSHSDTSMSTVKTKYLRVQ